MWRVSYFITRCSFARAYIIRTAKVAGSASQHNVATLPSAIALLPGLDALLEKPDNLGPFAVNPNPLLTRAQDPTQVKRS